MSPVRPPSNLALCAAALLALAACGPREPGPHSTEHGEIQFWNVTDSALVFGEECSDAEDFRGDIEPPKFEKSSFFIWKIDEDGKTAVAQDCDTTDPDSCEDLEPELVFEIDGHDFIFDPEPVVNDITTSDCDLEIDEKWLLTDEGETMKGVFDVASALVGDPAACAALEAEAESQSTNGQGFDGCVVTLEIDAEFHSSRSP